MDNKTYELTLLYDFFGELLTDTQREYFEYYYSDDLSLGEISQLTGVSRQGVRGVLLRAERLLREYEAKTHVVERFRLQGAKIDGILSDVARLRALASGETLELADRIGRGLCELKG